MTRDQQQASFWVLSALAIAVAGAIVWVGVYVFTPVVKAKSSEKTLYVPALNYASLADKPTLHARPKPLESAAQQDLLQITGKTKFGGVDALAIVLQWQMLQGSKPKDSNFPDWETTPFILCDFGALREIIYRDIAGPDAELTPEQKHGKYVSPHDLRHSKGFFNLLLAYQNKRQADPEKFNFKLTPEERKANEVYDRLTLFDSISQNNHDTGYLQARSRHKDPYLFVKLDQKEHSTWFSLADLEELRWKDDKSRKEAEEKWNKLMKERYPDDTQVQAFPADDVRTVLAGYDEMKQAYVAEDAGRFDQASQQFFAGVREVSQKHGPYPGTDPSRILWSWVDQSTIEDTIALEMRFNAVKPFRWAWIIMLGSLVLLIVSGLFSKLGQASRQAAGGNGNGNGALEQGPGMLDYLGKALYGLGLTAYLVSLGFQCFGFYCRVMIAGRPPVTTMYETVIWVSFMSAVFAVILELVYRWKVFAVAGAVAATFGLILADQLPLTLDPKLDPLVAVLQSNYWLIIHVLTIVSSYAGGTLAFAMANVALFLIVFFNPRREVIKMLSNFTYQAIKIAVILLAAGTFLGGWWAAEAWGRFWGWDPKEVWALIALVAYVIPLHMRYMGWVKDFGLAVAAVLCYSAILMAWYGVNFVLGAGLHSYGFGGGGPYWVLWVGLLFVEWTIVAGMVHLKRQMRPDDRSRPSAAKPQTPVAAV